MSQSVVPGREFSLAMMLLTGPLRAARRVEQPESAAVAPTLARDWSSLRRFKRAREGLEFMGGTRLEFEERCGKVDFGRGRPLTLPVTFKECRMCEFARMHLMWSTLAA